MTATPLVIGRGGVESDARDAGPALAGRPASPSDEERERHRGRSPPSPPSPRTARDTRRTPPSDPSGSSAWPHTDPLTGIANERTVARVLELELARAGRQGGEVSLALFDIDDFRAANANDGRAADDILRRVAAVLSESVRLVDTVGRIGGDEFVLVAPGAAGVIVAKRVQDGIAALPGRRRPRRERFGRRRDVPAGRR